MSNRKSWEVEGKEGEGINTEIVKDKGWDKCWENRRVEPQTVQGMSDSRGKLTSGWKQVAVCMGEETWIRLGFRLLYVSSNQIHYTKQLSKHYAKHKCYTDFLLLDLKSNTTTNFIRLEYCLATSITVKTFL